MQVSQCISILSMWVDIFTTGQCIWLGAQPSCLIADQVVESREVLRPTDLATRELFGGHKVFEVLVIREHEYDVCRALEVVVPLSEGLEYCEQLFVIDLVVELRWLHAARVECDRVDVAIVRGDLGDDRSDHVVRSISFNNNRIVRVEMCQDGGLGEGGLEGFECLSVVRAPSEWGVLAGEANQGNDDVGEPDNESTIEVDESQKCLDCLEISWGQPVTDSISLGRVHGDASGGDHEAQELDLLCVEQALLGFRVQVVLAKALQDTSDVNPMLFQGV